MKKTVLTMVALVVCLLLAFTTALAASYDGSIWTGKPNSLGIGYYCTAAQNRSQGDVSLHWARAKTWKPNGEVIVAEAAGNNRAVASTGSVKPYKGWGSYGEYDDGGKVLWSTEGNFVSSAWD